MAAIAKKHNWMLIDVRLSDREPTDLSGMPGYNETRTRATYLPFDEFPLVGDELPINPETGEKYAGWLVLLDEFKNASPAVQSAAYKFVLDRKVGTYDLHPECHVVAAGNLDTDGALAQPMSTALISRFSHLYVYADLQEWIEAVGSTLSNIDIIAYLNFKNESFYTFNPKLTTPYACPRTWVSADKTMEGLKKLTSEQRKAVSFATLAGVLGEGVVADYMTFLECKRDLISFEEIMKDPQGCKVPSMSNGTGIVWATAFMVVDHMEPSNLLACLDYLKRFPAEFIAAAARGALTRHKDWISTCTEGTKFQKEVYNILFPS